MTVTDASLWVSRFLPDDSFHAASRVWLENSVGAGLPLFAPASLLAEVAGAVARACYELYQVDHYTVGYGQEDIPQ